MQSESSLGRVIPLPLRSLDCGFSISEELARIRQLARRGGVARRSLTSPPDLCVDMIALECGAAYERPWRAGRVVVQCLGGNVQVVTPAGARDLIEGEILYTEARLIRSIAAREPSAVMATVVMTPDLARLSPWLATAKS